MALWKSIAAWLRSVTSRPAIVAADLQTPAERLKMRVSDVALAEARMSYGEPLTPWRLPDPPPYFAQNDALAMDRDNNASAGNLYASFLQGTFSEGLGFLGYPYLAELSQRPEYRLVVEIWAAECTREWINFSGDPARIELVEAGLKRFKIRDHIRRLVELDGYFGRGQLFVDMGHDMASPELRKPLVVKAKVKPGSIKGFKPIEPFWSYPGTYESTNPLAPGFYVPKFWYVMQAQVHTTRLMTIVGRELPDMLKPAYSFGGLALTQMIKPYVDNWLRTRQSVSDLLHSFSTMVLATNMSSILLGGPSADVTKRVAIFNAFRDNRGAMVIDKETEELSNVSTPLGSLDALQSQSLEQIASVSGIPLVVLLGVTPSGLNASSDGELRAFYAKIGGYQERVLREPMHRIIELVQLDIDGTIDPELTWNFVDLWETPEAEKAAVRKSDADMDVAYVGAGVVSADDVRKRIVEDEDSPYYGMKLEEPEPLEDFDPEGDGGDPGTPGDNEEDDGPPAQDAAPEWSEEKHPRSKDGKFGSGGGGGAPAAKTAPKAKSEEKPADAPAPAAKPAKPAHPKVAGILGEEGVARLRELIVDKKSKAKDILAALRPLDDAQKEMTPTLAVGTMPDQSFWQSRTYTDGTGGELSHGQALTYLEGVAASYAGSGGVKRDKQARILLGPPAAGKSTSAERIAATEGYAIVDGDDAKKIIPEFDEGVGASAVHEESGMIGSDVLANMTDRGDNVILPLVGGSPGSIEKRIAMLKAKGYSVTVDLVDVNEDEAARRMAGRALSKGRHISSSYFASIGDGPLRTYEHLKDRHFDVGFGRINGNGGFQEEQYVEAVKHPTAKKGHRLFGE